MSRIGRQPISVSELISVCKLPDRIEVTGPAGKVCVLFGKHVTVDVTDSSKILVLPSGQEAGTAHHGLMRKLIFNAVRGVEVPWVKKLELVGVGFNASFKSGVLTLNVGFSNPIDVVIPQSITCNLLDSTHISLSSPDRQLVGQVAANVRSVRPPEPYKGKGIRYSDEVVRKKAGKAFGS